MPSHRAEVGLGFGVSKAGVSVVGWLDAESLEQRPAHCSHILQGEVQLLTASGHRCLGSQLGFTCSPSLYGDQLTETMSLGMKAVMDANALT